MTLFRTLLWWLLLAALGALAWDLLALDLGEVVLRWHGRTISTTVAFFLASWGLLWFGLWLLWSLLSLPFTGWQRLAQAQARNRLVNGLIALHQGRNVRAESLLDKAAGDSDAGVVARLAAREAAFRRGDLVAVANHQAALAGLEPLAAAINSAELALLQDKPALVLELLQPWAEKRGLPPRALQLQGAALVAGGRAFEAISLLPELGREQSLSSERLLELERIWQAASLRQSAHANELHQRWNQLPAPARENPELLIAFSARAGELGLETEAGNALADAIERHWNESLVRQFALLPPAREDLRLARAENWRATHADSPGLSLCLGHLYRRAQQLGPAEELLSRAIAQGAGAHAWEELGQVFTAQDNPLQAQACYANALRSLRGEPARPLGGRSLREQIADEAVAEQRNEHGLPQLRP